MIGEQFDYGDEICGAVVSVRMKIERISIWTKNASNEAAQVSNRTKHVQSCVHTSVCAFDLNATSIGFSGSCLASKNKNFCITSFFNFLHQFLSYKETIIYTYNKLCCMVCSFVSS